MRKTILLSPLLLALTSCVIDDYGDIKIASWFWFALIIFIIFIVVAGLFTEKEKKETNERLAKRNQNLSQYKHVGRYVGGHPDIDRDILYVSVIGQDGALQFYDQASSISMPRFRFSIPYENIVDITVEDASTIERRVTAGRLLLVGIFAFAWKKQKKTEISFVVIDWIDEKFAHTTTFIHEGKLSMQKANTVRNFLIRLVR